MSYFNSCVCMMDSPLHAKVGEGLHHHFRDHLQLVSSAGSINSGTIISNSSSMTTLGSSLSATTSNGIVNTNQANSLTNDVIKTGHFKIKKRKNYKERFCVLRCESSDGPARFEYYESEKKFRHNSAPKLSIILTDCFHICRKYGSLNNNDHLLCFFTKDDCITIAFDDDKKLSEWLQALNDMNNFKLKEKNAKYERVWQITISKNKNPDRENLAGVHRLCLTNNKKLHLVSVDSSENEPKIHEIALSCVRRLGHSKKYFQLELGRFASIGAGRIIMLTDEETTSRDMHEAILNKIEHTSSCNDSEPRSMRSDASRPRSLSTSEGFRPTSTRRTSREVILPSSNSIIGSTSSVISTTSTSTTPSTPITLVSLHNSLASPGPAYSTILSSIRGRCDSLPSNYRNTITNPKSTAAITVQDGSYLPMAPISKQNHGEVAKNNFVSSPITAASTTISTVQSLKESTVSTSAITVNTCSNVQKTSQTSATALTTTTTPAAAAVSTANCDKKSQEIVKDEQNEVCFVMTLCYY